jgi:hypothetical protein
MPDDGAPTLDERLDALAEGVCACGCGRQLTADGPDPFFIDESHQRVWKLRAGGHSIPAHAQPPGWPGWEGWREAGASSDIPPTFQRAVQPNYRELRERLTAVRANARAALPSHIIAASPAAQSLIRAGFRTPAPAHRLAWHTECPGCGAISPIRTPRLRTRPEMIGWECPACQRLRAGPYPIPLWRKEGPDYQLAIAIEGIHRGACYPITQLDIISPSSAYTYLHIQACREWYAGGS